MKRKLSALPICVCGSRDFEARHRGRNALGRPEFRLACRKCGAEQLVDKTAYALFRYLGQTRPSIPFLKLFDLR
jgi:hypothetical protein